ncbi:DEAD/DEAH box helicase [Vagococcus lutrae]|uniref:DEAD/DEAH box helicase n=1 Tax=Vagococcus lutrae TaxID=81947 RepID=UPI00200BF73A|nr:SNF2-related protein [Vagococcus lutrae]MDT2825011.1 SNF2-related protein [Vagococcus lutrae]UQF18294.1 SNF2-related protein [Vagococcus lutrae]
MIKSKKDVINLKTNLNQIYYDLRERNLSYYNANIEEAWEKLKNEAVHEYCKKLSVDILSTVDPSIPINWLVNRGYHTIFDVMNEEKSKLEQLFGSFWVDEIQVALKVVKKSLEKDIHPVIDLENLSYKEQELLSAVYQKKNQHLEVEELLNDLMFLEQKIGDKLTLAANKRGVISELFQKKSVKKQINEAISFLNSASVQSELETIKSKYDALFKDNNIQDITTDFSQDSISYYVEIENVIGVSFDQMTDDLPSQIVDEVNSFPINTDNLHIQFRNYQLFGAKYALYFKRTLLGDEMGLGKTIQALGLINHLFQNNQRYAIVVCPYSILLNWTHEIKKFSELPLTVFHGQKREAALQEWLITGGVMITTYEHTKHLNIAAGELDVLVVDEAHYIKNPEAQRSKNVYTLSDVAEYVLFMSGTPLENRIDEMKQLVTQVNPSIGNQLSEHFYKLEPNNFKKTIQTVYLRRNRKDVLKELPDLEIKEEWLPFGKKEKIFYDQAVSMGKLMLMRRSAFQGKTPEQSPKLYRLLEICEQAKKDKSKVIIFSYFKEVLHLVHSYLEEDTFDIISGDIKSDRRQEIITEFSKSQDKHVLISQVSAGGVGLNIQAANIVILCEPQWKPSTENQAISRAYRMGQTRKVRVHRLLTEESIDESMLEVLGYKTYLFDLYARESEVVDRENFENNQISEEKAKQKILQMEKERLEKVKS